MTTLHAVQIIESPIGLISIGCTDRGLSQLEIQVRGNTRTEFSNDAQAASNCSQVARQLHEYFSGKRKSFEVSIDVSGTPFQKSVWQAIAETEFGAKISYGEIAQRIGNPAAARAVGGAVGANPVPIVIGCHRVLGSKDSITGYSGGEGIKTKLWLLAHERIEYAA